jgi:hypothetical protein
MNLPDAPEPGPSPYRWPVTIAVAIVAPPLALAAWIWLSGTERASYLRSWWIRGGITIIVIGALPLLAVILWSALGLLADPNPNPVGLGLLFVFAGILGCLLIIVGILLHALRKPA